MRFEEIEVQVGKFHIRYAKTNGKLFILFCLQHFWKNAKNYAQSIEFCHLIVWSMIVCSPLHSSSLFPSLYPLSRSLVERI